MAPPCIPELRKLLFRVTDKRHCNLRGFCSWAFYQKTAGLALNGIFARDEWVGGKKIYSRFKRVINRYFVLLGRVMKALNMCAHNLLPGGCDPFGQH